MMCATVTSANHMRSISGHLRFVRVLFALAFLAGTVSLSAQEGLRIVPLVRDERVLVSFELVDGFSDDVRAAILSGLKTTFTYTVDLRLDVPVWADRTMASVIVTNSVEYDNLTRLHTVVRMIDGRTEQSQRTDDEAIVKQWMTSFKQLPLFRTSVLLPNRDYYVRVSEPLLRQLKDRPVTRIRWPHGTADMSFFEKNLPSGAPSWLETVTVPTTGSRGGKGDKIVFPIVEDLATLTYLANLASLELHVHQWTVPEWLPDRMVIDLDPGAPADLHECAKVALLVRDRLADEGLSCAPVTSGSKGLHLYAALEPELTSDEVREKAQTLAQELQEENKLVVWKMTKSLRPGKVFLDWSQNTGAKTTISPYSLRGKLSPYVASPRTWDEIEEGAEERHALEQLTLEEVLKRADEHGDIFGDLLHG